MYLLHIYGDSQALVEMDSEGLVWHQVMGETGNSGENYGNHIRLLPHSTTSLQISTSEAHRSV